MERKRIIYIIIFLVRLSPLIPTDDNIYVVLKHSRKSHPECCRTQKSKSIKVLFRILFTMNKTINRWMNDCDGEAKKKKENIRNCKRNLHCESIRLICSQPSFVCKWFLSVRRSLGQSKRVIFVRCCAEMTSFVHLNGEILGGNYF